MKHIWRVNADGSRLVQMTSGEKGESSGRWSPDGSAIYFIAPEPKTDEDTARDKLRDDVFRFDENFKQRHVWKVAVADGIEPVA